MKNDFTMKELAKEIKINEVTLMNVENNKMNILKAPYYWKLVCDYFNINNIQYLELYNMKEDSIKNKLIKIRSCVGARTWEDTGKYLGYSRGFIFNLMNGYSPEKKYLDKINKKLEEFK